MSEKTRLELVGQYRKHLEDLERIRARFLLIQENWLYSQSTSAQKREAAIRLSKRIELNALLIITVLEMYEQFRDNTREETAAG